MSQLHATWAARVRPTIEPITGALPDAAPDALGRRRHGADFAWLHGEFTRVAASEEGATW
jgi:hypothetical protein